MICTIIVLKIDWTHIKFELYSRDSVCAGALDASLKLALSLLVGKARSSLIPLGDKG